MTSPRRLFGPALRIALAAVAFTFIASVFFGGCQSSGVGDPCVPEEEYLGSFAGFKLSEENIESRSFQCKTRICLVNHFQGRVSCPLGQPAPTVCDPANGDADCNQEPGTRCTLAGQIVNDCDPSPCGGAGVDPRNCNEADGGNEACGGAVCHAAEGFCECDPDVDPLSDPQACAEGRCCPADHVCDPDKRYCTVNVCSKPQSELGEDEQRCYLPGSDVPVAVPVCSQCAATSRRTAEDAVYCSCRCGVADGQPDEPNFNFCECPEGFSCEEVRPYLGPITDPQLSGKYCVKQGTSYDETVACGAVEGWIGDQCDGTG